MSIRERLSGNEAAAIAMKQIKAVIVGAGNRASIYSNVSTIKVGENIQSNARLADKISIRLEPTLKKSTMKKCACNAE